jgi:preprotein translocase subunit SecF
MKKVIKFYEKRKIYFALSLGLFLIGIIFMIANGVTLDIQFKGGTILKYTYSGDLDQNEVAAVIEDTINKPVGSQIVEDVATGAQRIVLSFAQDSEVTAAEQVAINNALEDNFPDNTLALSESNTVEPYIGHRFLTDGIIALALAALMIVIYVAIRFKRISGVSAGVMALIALVHDCLMVFFTFVIFKIPLNDAFIAVVLTIIGYSINDTIVVYDRIRENTGHKDIKDVGDLMNLSVSQTLSRSVNTAVATFTCILICLVFAWLYGIDSIVVFALPMAIGIISGCYSTICIAGPLWVMWQKHKQKQHPHYKGSRKKVSKKPATAR